MMSTNICTIYLLTNSINQKIYVGQTWGLLSERMGKNGRKYGNCDYLYHAIQKYGTESFYYEVLAQCSDQKSADYLEDYYINLCKSRDHSIGYNLREGGSAGKHSEETKKKMSDAHTEEWKENNSKMMIERHATTGHPMQGKHHTPEAKSKISKTSKGRKRDPEAVAKGAAKRKMPLEKEQSILNAYLAGQIISDIELIFETGRSSIYRILKRNNISRERDHKVWIGKTHSEETKQKMSDAKKEYWEDKKKNET